MVIIVALLTAIPLLYGEYQIIQPIPLNYAKLTFDFVNAIVDADGNFTIMLSIRNIDTMSLTINGLLINGTRWNDLRDKI